jgi:hypothetical protein
VSFATPITTQELPPPEAELMFLLREAQYGKPPPSFGVVEEAREGWDQVVGQFQGFVDLLVRNFSHYAWVETSIEGRIIVRTGVSWTGDFESAWQDQLLPDQMDLHRRSLAIALASRATMMRTFAVVASTAGKLSALMVTPGGAILALPAAWKFINAIRAEIEKYQQITEENTNGQ